MKIGYVLNADTVKLLDEESLLRILKDAVIPVVLHGKLKNCRIKISKNGREITISHEVL